MVPSPCRRRSGRAELLPVGRSFVSRQPLTRRRRSFLARTRWADPRTVGTQFPSAGANHDDARSGLVTANPSCPRESAPALDADGLDSDCSTWPRPDCS